MSKIDKQVAEARYVERKDPKWYQQWYNLDGEIQDLLDHAAILRVEEEALKKLRQEQDKKAAEDFAAKQAALLDEVPEVVACFIRVKAWEDGHSSGYQEVLSHVESLAYDMKDIISALKAK
jgi:hypothetical protein